VGCRVWDVGRPHYERAKRHIAVPPQATSHRTLAGFKTPTPDPPPREGDFVRCGTASRAHCVGCKLQSTSHGTRLRTASHRLAQYELHATGRPVTFITYHSLRTTNPQGGHMGPPLRRDEPRTTTAGHKLPANRRSFQTPRTRPDTPAAIRGPCLKRSRGTALAET